MVYQFNKDEQKFLSEIKNSFYMQPTIKRINDFMLKQSGLKKAWKEVFNQIYSILVDAKDDVEKILEERKRKGEKKDIRQSNEINCWQYFFKCNCLCVFTKKNYWQY